MSHAGPILLSAAALLLGGCYDSDFRTKGSPSQPAAVTTTIARFNGALVVQTPVITGDIVLSGVVTTSDEAGNFYRTFCIEEAGAGLEVMAGIDQLHNDFPVGCRVTLHLRGLAAGRSRGVVQIGRDPAPGSGYTTDYIGSKPALDAHVERCDDALRQSSPPCSPSPN